MKQYRGLIIFLACVALGFVTLQVWHQREAPAERTAHRERALQAIATIYRIEMRKAEMDGIRVVNVGYDNNVMTFDYQLKEAIPAQTSHSELLAALKKGAMEDSCTLEPLARHISEGLMVVYRLADVDSNVLGQVRVGSSDCASAQGNPPVRG
ncbi:hypothetical protein [Pseudomonas sp. KNUC1026]|uniref:hypothetical protein n=1 Tax=Pseudomonas sp. KNUC1026 TaxID=2893890 RepID=UPI001F3ED978|nr:hypothetical protein [Pseudomonas sp. KNUC1026]UFH51353.1 hypothetical protein LN139_10270 [Pseudomonas sp. KNUC1026]